MDIGIKIKKLREEKGINQQQLAELLVTTQSNISHYEQGRVEPNLQTIKQLTEIFNVSADFLLDIETKNNTIERYKANIKITKNNNKTVIEIEK